MAHGTVTAAGVFVQAGGIQHRLPTTRTPVGEWVAALDICPECGGDVCDCITPAEMAALLARIDADPHGYNDLSGLELPY